jgi:hypothetical protein
MATPCAAVKVASKGVTWNRVAGIPYAAIRRRFASACGISDSPGPLSHYSAQDGSVEQPCPESYDDYGWLASFFTLDGRTIYSLIHNEFHGNERPALCTSRIYLRCWENSITAGISYDGGDKFGRWPGVEGVIANLPYRYVGDQPHQFGYFNPTNIVHIDGFFYFFVSMINTVEDTYGVCLMQTPNIGDPTSWRGWDGSKFGIRFVNPYAPTGGDPKQHICAGIGNGSLMFSLGSVSFFRPARQFIMIMRRQRWERVSDGTIPGVYFSTSPDLINWSPPVSIISDTEASTDSDIVQFYPSMLDPDGGDFNFQNVSTHPALLSVEFRTQRVNQWRRLVSRQLEIRTQ